MTIEYNGVKPQSCLASFESHVLRHRLDTMPFDHDHKNFGKTSLEQQGRLTQDASLRYLRPGFVHLNAVHAVLCETLRCSQSSMQTNHS